MNKFKMMVGFAIALLGSTAAMAWTQNECKSWDNKYRPGSAHKADSKACPDTTPNYTKPSTTPVVVNYTAPAMNTAVEVKPIVNAGGGDADARAKADAQAKAEQAQRQDQTQQQKAIADARQELQNANTAAATLNSNPNASAEQMLDVQTRVVSANKNLNNLTANGGEGGKGGAGGGGGQGGVGTGTATANGAAGSGNQTTMTIGGTVYQATAPVVAGAIAGAQHGSIPPAGMGYRESECGGDFDITEEDASKSVKAPTSTFFGLFNTKEEVGKVYKVTYKQGSTITKGTWETIGMEGGRWVQERVDTGWRKVTLNMVLGQSTGGALTLNGMEKSGATNTQAITQRHTNYIEKEPCSVRWIRYSIPDQPVAKVEQPAPPVEVDALAAAVAAKIAASQTLTAPVYNRKFVQCPKEGCKAPTNGYYTYEREERAISSSVEVGAKAKSQSGK